MEKLKNIAFLKKISKLPCTLHMPYDSLPTKWIEYTNNFLKKTILHVLVPPAIEIWCLNTRFNRLQNHKFLYNWTLIDKQVVSGAPYQSRLWFAAHFYFNFGYLKDARVIWFGVLWWVVHGKSAYFRLKFGIFHENSIFGKNAKHGDFGVLLLISNKG